MMKYIYILGAGGFGREVLSWLSDWCSINQGWEIIGFIDDDCKALDGFEGLPKVCSSVAGYQPESDAFLVCALGNPKIKKRVVESLLARGAQFLTLRHPSAIIGQRVKLGSGVVICPRVVITCDISIGDFVTINAASTVGHDVSIGNYTTLSGHCDVTGGATLEDCVFMGSHAVVLPKVHVGPNACIGSGSVALRKVAQGSTVFGIPAKRITG